MSREIKRVPLDFDYPLKTVWAGYKNPYVNTTECTACGGTGYGPEALSLYRQWYGQVPFHPSETGCVPYTHETKEVRAFAERNVKRSPSYYGVGEAAIMREAIRLATLFNQSWLYHLAQEDVDVLWEKGRLWDFAEHPTAEEVNKWAISGGLGHDAVNAGYCIAARVEKQGASTTCPHCGGDGSIWRSNADKALSDAWVKTEPPTGDGWQVWETVSEGSPISPVFQTSDEVITWLVDNDYTQEGAEAFVKSGWAPSGWMLENGDVRSGIDGLA